MHASQAIIAKVLVTAFLLLICGVPINQAIFEKLDDQESSLRPLFERAPTRENLKQLEKEIEDASFAKSFVQPRVQQLLSRFGRAGNERALIGNAGFLYYTPGLTFLAGPSFVDRNAIELRELQARDVDDDPTATLRADPRPAIFAFRDMLARRGIELVLFPVPDKTMLQPLQLHGRGETGKPMPVPRNMGWQAFVRDLGAHHVALFDPTPSALQPEERPRFLIQDTHWTPEWMERVATDLARFVTAKARLEPVASPPKLHVTAQRVERVGDLVDMLMLPEGQSLFSPQPITVHTVQGEDDAPWEPDPNADVLLLGDSFTNVFSMDTMGWGEAAGLAPQLALALHRNVDVIALNDSGAFATRQALWHELGAGSDRLAGKRVVIWELASRELAVGDWKMFDWEGASTAPKH